ncbi:unnamed protein product [Oreochromis niloticus]|nr:unnamed protein product [Mustela putorius furo]
MQPPPRKVKESQQMKVVFSEQLSKLQTKQHQDTELLEEIRSFSKHRAAIEKEYGQALQRLAVQYQKRDWQRGNTDAITSGSVFSVWRSVVDATAQTAASRLFAAEEYRRLSGQVSKSLRNAKDVRAKRGLERLQRVQAEVVDALRELQRVKKCYHDFSHIASIAREKTADAQARARKSEHGIFHFKTGLHKTTKLTARLKECDDRLTEVRNEYLLTLAAVRAHRQHYYTNDLPFIMEVSVMQEVCGSEEEGCLVKEAKKWTAKVAKDHKIIAHGERALQMLASRLKLLSGETALSVEQKIAEVQESVRKAKLNRAKAEARLALLSESTPGTEQWLHAAMNQVEEELERERHLSEQRKSTEDFSSGDDALKYFVLQEEEFELTDFEDYDDNGEIFTDPVSASGVCVYPAACRVIYSYQASQSDELSIIEGEELQVIEDGDMEDWLKVCNSCGQVGYVPERYVQLLCLPAEDSTPLDSSFSSTSSTGTKETPEGRGVARALYSYQAQSAEELSFQEGALIHLIRRPRGEVDDGFWEGELNGHVGVFPSLMVELVHDEGEDEEEKEEMQPLPTPTMPLFSPPIPTPSAPSCNSELSAASPSSMEDKQQAALMEGSKLAGNRLEAGTSSHSSPEHSNSPLRPCRAPPPPPTQKTSSQA